MHRIARILVTAAAAFALAGCAAFVTQNPGQGLSPVNAMADGAERHVMLFGTDVVSYFTDGAPRQGSREIHSEYRGVTFRFATAEHRRLFDAAPEKYIPQFGGFCTNGIVYGIPLGGSVSEWEIIDGKLYMFGGKGSHDAFNLDPRRNLELAWKYWREEVEGANAPLQAARRLVFRVPHYKTGRELAAEVAAHRKG